MGKFCEMLYFGAYYFEWMQERMVRRLVYPCMRPLLIWISYIFPCAKRNLAKRGLTPKQHVDNAIKLCESLSESNYGHTFEWYIGRYFTLFYIFAYFDMIWILRMIFGKDWGIIQITGENGLLIVTVICVLAGISASRMEATVGQDKTIKKYRRKPKSVHRKALALFLGCCALVLLGFYFLFIKRCFQTQ